jgi:hypothetical protein
MCETPHMPVFTPLVLSFTYVCAACFVSLARARARSGCGLRLSRPALSRARRTVQQINARRLANRMALSHARTSCTSAHASSITLREKDVVHLHRCAAGAHVVFIGTTGLPSMVMRGVMMNSVLNQTFAAHGATSSYILVNTPLNTSAKVSAMMENHFDKVGGPSACVILKYSVAWIGAACRRRGALVLVDTIDNHRAFSEPTLNNEHYGAMDAIIVQTEEHAEMVASWGHIGVVLPHPHGNLGGWSVAGKARARIRGVGFVVQDSKNYPTREDLHQIMLACCRVNATLYLVSSKVGGGLEIRPMARRNCSSILAGPGIAGMAEVQLRPHASVIAHARSVPSTCPRGNRLRKNETHTLSAFEQSWGNHVLPLRDTTHQRIYYESTKLLDLIDVGIVWRPGHQQGGNLAISNRPPTRLHWWWSHGIPTIGYPMNAYIDAARRAQYPEELLNLTTAGDIEHALRNIDLQEERDCLQHAAKRGGCLSSPWYSGLELLSAICKVGVSCGQPLRPVTSSSPNLPPTTSDGKGLCGSTTNLDGRRGRGESAADLVKLAASTGFQKRPVVTTMHTRVVPSFSRLQQPSTTDIKPKPSYKYKPPELIARRTGNEPAETLSLNIGIFDFSA